MPKFPDVTCGCCARTLPYHSFARSVQICNPCSIMTPNDIMLTTRLNMERALTIRFDTAKGRKDARIQAKLAEYAVTGKRCSACHHHLPIRSFGACATRGDGLQAICKSCNKMRLGIVESGQALSTWHTVRDALRAAATGPLNQST